MIDLIAKSVLLIKTTLKPKFIIFNNFISKLSVSLNNQQKVVFFLILNMFNFKKCIQNLRKLSINLYM